MQLVLKYMIHQHLCWNFRFLKLMNTSLGGCVYLAGKIVLWIREVGCYNKIYKNTFYTMLPCCHDKWKHKAKSVVMVNRKPKVLAFIKLVAFYIEKVCFQELFCKNRIPSFH